MPVANFDPRNQRTNKRNNAADKTQGSSRASLTTLIKTGATDHVPKPVMNAIKQTDIVTTVKNKWSQWLANRAHNKRVTK